MMLPGVPMERLPAGTWHGRDRLRMGRGTTWREEGVKIVGIAKRNEIATVMTRKGLLRMLDEKKEAITSRLAVKYVASISEFKLG